MARLTKRWRTALFILCFTLVNAVLFNLVSASITSAQMVAKADESGVRDFVEYWSASRLLFDGRNPYSPNELLKLQRSVGWPGSTALIMWNPPWTFPLTLPFGMLSYSLGQMAWLLVQLLLILVCTNLLARLYGNSSATCRIEWGVALSFVPTVFVLIIGQISPMVLAGITGFLVLESKGKWLAAGAALAVVSIKPHLLYLFWLALCLWICREGRWRIALGALMSFLLVALVPLYFDRDIYGQYFELYKLEGILQPFDQATPTLRNIFPLLFGRSDRWLQSLPTVIGFAWLIYYWRRNRARWQWSEELPLILLVSVTTSFFAWTYDYVVFLPALIEVTAWIKQTKLPWYRSWAALCYLTINIVHAVMRFWFAEEFGYVWLAPALLLSYIVYRFEKQRQSAAPPASLA
jgi:hypothetical protein